MQYQTSLLRGQPDNESIKQIQYYESLALEHDSRGYCVCTSEGKDSRILGHLFRRAGVKHFYLHSITGIDPPELVYFQRRNFEEYKSQGYLTYDCMYDKSFFALMRENLFPPMRHIRYCCAHLKEQKHQEQGDAIVSLGVRKFESVNRMSKRNELEIVTGKKNIIMPFDNVDNRRTFETCYQDNEKRVNPIAYWTNEMVWDYIKDAKLEQCCLYSEGFDRLGCIGCPMASFNGRTKEFNRWPAFKRLYLSSFEYIIAERNRRGMKVNYNTSTAEDWFNWWIQDTSQDLAVDEEQITFMIPEVIRCV